MHYLNISPQMQVLLVDNALNFVAAIIILVVGWMIAAWAARWIRTGLKHIPHFDATLRPLIASIVRYAIVVLTVIAVLQRFGVETTSLIAVLGAAGLAIGLALQGMLSNVAAGVMLIFLRPFRRGEAVQLGEAKGKIRELGLFRTQIVTENGVIVSIPNSTIFSGSISNFHAETRRRTNFIVPVDQATDIALAIETIMAVLEAHPKVLKNPAPGVPVDSFTENAINLAVQAWTIATEHADIKDDLQLKVGLALNEAKIHFPQTYTRLRVLNSPEKEKPPANPNIRAA